MDENNFDWSSWMTEKAEEAERIKKFTEYGKLGGRPKKEEVRYTNLTIRLSEKERAEIKDHADKFGLSMSEFLRQVGRGQKVLFGIQKVLFSFLEVVASYWYIVYYRG